MGERPTIAFRVSEQQKDNWEQFVAENVEYDSLSDLIRQAVAHEMSDQYGRETTVQGGGDERVGEVLTELNRVQQQVDELQATVEDTRDTVYDTTAAAPTAGDIMSALPATMDIKHGDDETGATALDVADELDAPVEVVKDRLNQLEVEYERIVSSEQNSVKFYAKDV